MKVISAITNEFDGIDEGYLDINEGAGEAMSNGFTGA